MLNNEFYNNPNTLDFINITKHKLENLKNNCNKQQKQETDYPPPTPSNTIVKFPNNADEVTLCQNSDEKEDSKIKAKIEKIKSHFEEKIIYNQKVCEAKGKAYSESYRKPPKKYQFKKGQSGNPKGRPPKIPTFSVQDAIYKAFYKEIETNQNGKLETKSLIEVLGETIVRDAIKKDGQSRKLLLQNPQFLRHNFMEPLIAEKIEKIPHNIDKERDAKLRHLLYQAMAEHCKDDEL